MQYPLQLMAISHVVWDWNGTLLDDLEIVIESLNVSIGRFGLPPIDDHQYRDHFTRPVRSFYQSLFGRSVSDMEWESLNKIFHDEYFSRVHRAPLAKDALEAIALTETKGWNQSLLSMTTHDRLVEIVASHGISDRFVRVEGLQTPTGGLKAAHLEQHLASLGIDPAQSVVVGDTPDDALAAQTVGASVVLYDGGSHHVPVLEAAAAPVAHTLLSAVEKAA